MKTAVPFSTSPILDDVTWRRMARLWAGTGVIPATQVSVPVYAPAMLVYADASGFNVKVSPGEAVVDGGYFADDATITLPINPPNATNPRIDLVVLRWDGPNNLAEYIVLQGTPAAIPAVPAPTQNQGGRWELPLAEVRVNVGVTNIAASAATDRRAYVRRWRSSATPQEIVSTAPLDTAASAQVLLATIQYIIGNTNALRLSLVRGAAGSNWVDTFIRFQQDIDNGLAAGGYLDVGNVAGNPIAALGAGTVRRFVAEMTRALVDGSLEVVNAPHVFIARTGEVAFRLYNNGGVAEWVFRQAAAPSHHGRISMIAGGGYTDYLAFNPLGGIEVSQPLRGTAFPELAEKYLGVGSAQIYVHGWGFQPRIASGRWGTTPGAWPYACAHNAGASGATVRIDYYDATSIRLVNDSGQNVYVKIYGIQ